MAGVHQKLYSAVCEKWRKEDERLVINCQKLTGLTADLLGVSHYFDCPLPSAVSIPIWGPPWKITNSYDQLYVSLEILVLTSLGSN